jgi:hypothetical protein
MQAFMGEGAHPRMARVARMALRFVGVLSGTVGLWACAGGDGELVTSSAVGRDDPGVTRDPPPSTRDDPEGACIVCDVNYNCSGPAPFGGGQLELSTGDGSCLPSLIDALCSGAIFGATGCTGGGGGPFTCGDTTCSPGTPEGTGVVEVVGSSTSSGGVQGTLPPNLTTATSRSGGTIGGGGSGPDAG